MIRITPEEAKRREEVAEKAAKERMESLFRRAATRGFNARKQNKKRTLNPFSCDTQPQQHMAWNLGYDQFEKGIEVTVIDDHELPPVGEVIASQNEIDKPE